MKALSLLLHLIIVLLNRWTILVLEQEFDDHCLKQDKVTFTHEKVVNIYLAYKKNLWPYKNSADITLGNSIFFGAVNLTKNANPDKYNHSGYGIGFDTRGSFSLSDGSGIVENVVIFSLSVRVNSWQWSNARIRRYYVECRERVFNEF